MFLRIILITIVLVSCKPAVQSVKKSKVKVFGDSLKIEYTYKGDTIYQKRTNLKWKKGNSSAKVHYVKSIWTTKQSANLNCNQKIHITKNNIDYSFCFDDVLEQTQQQLKQSLNNKWTKDSIINLQNELLRIEKGELTTITSNNYYLIFDLIQNINFNITDNLTDSDIVKIRVEHYQTSFSKGHIYYLINTKIDTIARYNLSDWIK